MNIMLVMVEVPIPLQQGLLHKQDAVPINRCKVVIPARCSETITASGMMGSSDSTNIKNSD